MPVTLTLRTHPDSNDVWLCNSTRMHAGSELAQTGVDSDRPVDPLSNPNRVLARFMLPYLENIKAITDEVNVRADAAEADFIRTPRDVAFDRHGLVTAIAQTRQLQRDVSTYLQITRDTSGRSDPEQREYLAEHVFAPFFLGSGFQIIGDAQSPWVDGISVYCQPILLAVAIARGVRGHEEKWEKMGRPSALSPGTLVLGVAVLGAGYFVLKR